MDAKEKGALKSAVQDLVREGDVIRLLKEEMRTKPSSEDQERLATEIKGRVTVLNELKEQHCETILWEIHHLSNCKNNNSKDTEDRIARLEQLLPSKMAKTRKVKRRKKSKKNKVLQEKKFNVYEGVKGIKCQRKIPHLLEHEGQGDSFCYFSKINHSETGFLEGETVYFTEKMDGTTIQATNHGVYKRIDNKAARASGKWHELADEKRYSLRRVDLDNRSNQHIYRAVKRYLPSFSNLPDGVCIYFEAIGPSIGKRFSKFAGLFDDEHSDTIYVFDTSINAEFVPFPYTVDLCRRVGLPCVEYSVGKFWLSHTIVALSSEPKYSALPTVPLEGFVVRPIHGSHAAKIRVDDISKIRYNYDDISQTPGNEAMTKV